MLQLNHNHGALIVLFSCAMVSLSIFISVMSLRQWCYSDTSLWMLNFNVNFLLNPLAKMYCTLSVFPQDEYTEWHSDIDHECDIWFDATA